MYQIFEAKTGQKVEMSKSTSIVGDINVLLSTIVGKNRQKITKGREEFGNTFNQ